MNHFLSRLHTRRTALGILLLAGVIAAAIFATNRPDPSTSKVTGLVVDPSGNPVSGLEIRCDPEEIHLDVNPQETVTNRQGRYTFRVRPGLRYIVRLTGQQSTFAQSEPFDVLPNEPSHVEKLTTRPANHRFTASIRNPNGSPASTIPIGYVSESFQPINETKPPKTNVKGEIIGLRALPDEPFSFWAIPETNTIQIWRGLDPTQNRFQVTLDPEQYRHLPPNWARSFRAQFLARQTTHFPDNTIRFHLPDLEGKFVSLTDKQFQGKPVVVNLWGSWCPGCLREIPTLVELQSRFRSKGLEVVGIAFEEGTDSEQLTKIREAMKDLAINYTILRGRNGVVSREGESARSKRMESVIHGLKGFDGYPTTILIDREGKIANHIVGFSAMDDATEQFLIEELKTEVTKLVE